jgi:hypothetical protein
LTVPGKKPRRLPAQVLAKAAAVAPAAAARPVKPPAAAAQPTAREKVIAALKRIHPMD